MEFAPSIKIKSQQEQIDSSFEIKQRDINYILNLRTDSDYLILKISVENILFDNYEKKLTITDIQNMHKTFINFSFFKNFVDFIKSHIENKKFEILKINNESILIRLKQENIEITIRKKKLDQESIIRNIYNEMLRYKNNQNNLEEKYEKLVIDNKKINQEIEGLKALNIELKKENEEIKEDIKQLKGENKNLKEANKDLEKKIGIYKIIDDEIKNMIKEDKNKSKSNIKGIIQENNNKKNKLMPFEKLENEHKYNSDQKKKKLNLDNINNNINNNELNKCEDIRPFNLKKNELNKNYKMPRMKSFSNRRSNTSNDLDFKNLDIIQEDYKQDEPEEFIIYNKRKRISDIYEEKTFNNGEKIRDRNINSLNININNIQHLIKNNNNNNILKNSLSYNNLSIQHNINKKIIRNSNSNSNNINLSKNCNDNSSNKTFTNMKIENLNNKYNIIGNFSNRRKINDIKKIKTEENFEQSKKRNCNSIDNKRNQIFKNNLKLKKKFSGSPIEFYRKKICFNQSKNKRNDSKENQNNKIKYETNTENKQNKSKKIFNNIYKEKNNLFLFNENKQENNQIINNNNISIKPKNNYKLKFNDNLKNYANIIKNHKGSNIINMTLQCLANVEQLVQYFLTNKKEIKTKYFPQYFSSTFLEVIENLWEIKSIKYYTPINCINIILLQNNNKFFFNSGELIKFILDNLHQELNEAPDFNLDFINYFDENFDNYFKNYEKYFKKNYQSIISNLFYLKYDSKITCFDCNQEFHNIQLSNMLEFSLEEVKEYNNIKNKLITINDCLKYYNNKQDFIYDKKCDNCQQDQILGKINKLLIGPKVLIINLNKKNDSKTKLVIDEIINLSDFFYDKKIKYNYELISVMMYLGDDYFISFCKSFVDKKWYKFIDSEVIPCSFRETNINGTPYLLFYSLIEN